MSPFPKSSKNPFMWNRFSKSIINTRREDYHNGRRRGYNHYEGRYNAPYSIGIELECARPNGYIDLMPTNFFSYESDCSINQFGYGVEFVSMPIPHTLARREEMWSGVCSWMESNEFKSWEFGESGCGLHVHVGREVLGSTIDERNASLGRLVYLYNEMIEERVKNRIFGRPCTQWAQKDSLSTLDHIRALNNHVSNEVFMEVAREKNRQSPYNHSDRYYEINVTNDATIEFRRGRGSINAKRIAIVVAFCDLLCEYASRVKKIEDLTQSKFVAYVMGQKKMQEHPLRAKFVEMGF